MSATARSASLPPRTARRKKVKSKPPKVRDFNTSSGPAVIPEYNPLQDEHLTHFFRSRVVQKQLIGSGMIDRHGRIIDQQKNKTKLLIIDQEFRNAEKLQAIQRKEEEDAIRRQQLLEHQEMEERRRLARIQRIKEEEQARAQQMREYYASKISFPSQPLSARPSRPPRPESSGAQTERKPRSSQNLRALLSDLRGAIGQTPERRASTAIPSSRSNSRLSSAGLSSAKFSSRPSSRSDSRLSGARPDSRLSGARSVSPRQYAATQPMSARYALAELYDADEFSDNDDVGLPPLPPRVVGGSPPSSVKRPTAFSVLQRAPMTAR